MNSASNFLNVLWITFLCLSLLCCKIDLETEEICEVLLGSEFLFLQNYSCFLLLIHHCGSVQFKSSWIELQEAALLKRVFQSHSQEKKK